jgi:hypothetical protein
MQYIYINIICPGAKQSACIAPCKLDTNMYTVYRYTMYLLGSDQKFFQDANHLFCSRWLLLQSEVCPLTGKPARQWAIFAKAYWGTHSPHCDFSSMAALHKKCIICGFNCCRNEINLISCFLAILCHCNDCEMCGESCLVSSFNGVRQWDKTTCSSPLLNHCLEADTIACRTCRISGHPSVYMSKSPP